MSSIAVVLPCRDHGRTLPDAVASVFEQTRLPEEIVVVDDGSRDLVTLRTLATLSAPGLRIVSTGETRGPGAARNLGIAVSSAESVLCLDADDLLRPEALAILGRPMEEDPGLEIVGGALEARGASGSGAPTVWHPPEPDLARHLAAGSFPSATLVRRRLWKGLGGFDETLEGHEDWDLWLRALADGARAIVVPEVVLEQRVLPGSRYRRAILRHRELKGRIRRRILPALEGDPAGAIVAADDFLAAQRRHRDHLRSRVATLGAEGEELAGRIGELRRGLRQNGLEPVSFGLLPGPEIDDLPRRLVVEELERALGKVSDRPGSSRTLLVAGEELAGGLPAPISRIGPDLPGGLVAALRARPEDSLDAVFLAEGLDRVPDPRRLVDAAVRCLAPGGSLWAAVPCHALPAGGDGPSWCPTPAGLRRLLARALPPESVETSGRGNLPRLLSFVGGAPASSLSPGERSVDDPSHPVIAVGFGRAPEAASPSGPGRSRTVPEGGAVILAYHRITDARLGPSSAPRAVTPARFREHLEWLDREADLLPLSAVVAGLTTGDLPERAVAVTVDDATLDTLRLAAPAVEGTAVPVTVFATSLGWWSAVSPWWADLDRLIELGAEASRVALELDAGTLDLPLETEGSRAETRRRLTERLYSATAPARDALLARLARAIGAGEEPVPTDRFLRAAEILELSRRGWTIGGHGASHLALSHQDPETRWREIVDNRDALESLLEERVAFFAYPYGDAPDAAVEIVEAAGFDAAFVVGDRIARPFGRRFRIPRVELTPARATGFAEWMDGIFTGRTAISL